MIITQGCLITAYHAVNKPPIHRKPLGVRGRNAHSSTRVSDDGSVELDWVCVTWDADLGRHAESWRYHSFRGDAWTSIHKEDRKRYLLNAYRVLLTRARQGMVIFIPPGDESDPTRTPAFYDDTYEYLTRLGVAEV